MFRLAALAILVCLFSALAAFGELSLAPRHQAQAHFPHGGIDFSIGVGNQCDSTNGPTTCDVAGTFTLEFRLNSIPQDFSYGGYDVVFSHTPGLFVDSATAVQTGAGVWPACAFPAQHFKSGLSAFGCSVGVPPARDSNYTGVLARLNYICGSSQSSDTIALLAGPNKTDLAQAGFLNHGEQTNEVLTINCEAAGTIPTPTPTVPGPTDAPSRTPTPTRTPTPPRTPCSPAPCPTATPLPLQRNTVSAGGAHTCITTTTGGVQCWGWNSYGQLGTGSATGPDACAVNACSIRPVDVMGLSGTVVSVAAGGRHTCALLSSGAVQCWGANESGQLGDGQLCGTSCSTPVNVDGLRGPVSAITTGGDDTCAVLNSGFVQCWGDNRSGQLGNGTTTNSSTPVDVAELVGNVVSITSRGQHTCVLTVTGAVQCWGENRYGQLGAVTNETCSQALPELVACSTTPLQVSTLTSGMVAISAGGTQSCAVSALGGVKCWGSNVAGQLGDALRCGGGNCTTPVDVSGLDEGIVSVSAGWFHTCVMTKAGAVKCWGSNGGGQLGDGGTCGTSCHTPVQVAGLEHGAVSLAAGSYHTCAITEDGSIECWGANGTGQLGDGSSPVRVTPSAVLTEVGGEPLRGVSSLTLGALHSCSIIIDGSVKCWGNNWFGKLGDGTTLPHAVPRNVIGLDDPMSVAVSSENHTCGVLKSGEVWCWGASRPAATRIDVFAGGARSIAKGPTHICVLMSSGGVKCVGSNDYGQLGDGTTTGRSVPIDVSGTADAVAIAAGGYDTCMLDSVGGVKCWGLGFGNGPVDISGLGRRAVAIAVGGGGPNFGHLEGYACAILADRTVQCWGTNAFGELGDGTTTAREAPAPVAGVSHVVALAAEEYHVCAVTEAGAVYCWGLNQYSQLGRACGFLCANAGEVVGLPGEATNVAVGGAHTCAVMDDATVECWGGNWYGQLGDGTMAFGFTPVLVKLAGIQGTAGFDGDGGQAQDALLSSPRGASQSTDGELFFADTENSRVRRIAPIGPSGTITTVAGGGRGTCGGAETSALGDGCPPTDAVLAQPSDVFVDGDGVLYVADTEHCRVRRVSDDVISTIAGTGVCGFSGDGGSAVAAQLNKPRGVYADDDGNVYIADTENCRVRKVRDGVITTVAGNGICAFGGDGGAGVRAELNRPSDVYRLLPSEDLVIADTANNRIRRIDLPLGTISTLAGTGTAGQAGDEGPAVRAQLNGPEAVSAGDFAVFIADTQNDRVRRIDVQSGVISTFGDDPGETSATNDLKKPAGISIGSALVVSNTDDQTVLGTAASNNPRNGGTVLDIQPSHPCSFAPGSASIDWALPAVLLGMLAGRKRLLGFFARLLSLRPVRAAFAP